MTSRLGWISRRGLVIGAAALVAASGTAGALAATSSVTTKSAAHAVAGSRRAISRDVGPGSTSKFATHQPAVEAPGGMTSYPSTGVSMRPAVGLLGPALSATSALTSFAEQGIAQGVLGHQLGSTTPSVNYEIVTEQYPVYPGIAPGSSYPAWVVTYHDTSPQDYGPTPITDPSSLSCDFVGILDLDNQAWTEFFQSCD